jgi:transcriptional regulator with XRE-family HTH domain
MSADLLEPMGIEVQGRMTKTRAPRTNGKGRSTKGKPKRKAVAPPPPAPPSPPKPPAPPSDRKTRQKKNKKKRRRRGPNKRPHPPKPLGVEIFHLRHEQHWTQDQIAEKYGKTQSVISGYLKRAEKYYARSGVPRRDRDLPPAAQLRLAMDLELIDLIELLGKTRDLSAVAREPHVTTHACYEGNAEQWRRTIERCDPPRVGWTNAEQRLIERIGKLRQSLAAADAAGNGPSGMADPPCANARYSPLARAEPYDVATDKRWRARDGGKRTCGKRCANDHVASLPERATYWRYQALGLEQGLDKTRRLAFVSQLLVLDEMAVSAAAMHEAGGECGVGEGERGRGGDEDSPTLPLAPSPPRGPAVPVRSQRYYLELQLILDGKYDREETERIMAHYDEARGQFHWQVPAEDLRWLVKEEEVQEEAEEEAEALQQEQGGARMGWADGPPLPKMPAPGSSDPIPFASGPPAVISPRLRQWIIDSPFDQRVSLLRLDGTACSALHLYDVPNDQSSVVIWELVEEVIKSEDGTHVSTRGEFKVQGSTFNVEGDPAPNPETLNLEPGTGNSWPLTDELRQKLFRAQAPEGMVVLTRDGRIYSGDHLGRCGLVQRGIVFLRELCHSTPAWGESIWRTFKAKPK